MTLREERAAEVRRLRDIEKLSYRAIADRLGIASSTVSSLLNDPDGSKLQARKDSYRGVCGECGKRTDGSRGAALAPGLCMDCQTWTEEEIVSAMKGWARTHGGVPPRVQDWRRSGEQHPSSSVVVRRFGWNVLLLAAGFELVCDRRPETQLAIESPIRAGATVAEVAEQTGCSAKNIYRRLHYRGTSVQELRGRRRISVKASGRRRQARDERAAASQLRPQSADVLNVSTQSRASAAVTASPVTTSR